jgi:hypothetical protein
MNNLAAVLTGAGLGVLGMYVFDPEVGRRRRALARDKASRLQRKAKEAASATVEDLKNRAFGTLAEGKSRLLERTVDDSVLQQRVRSELGFLVRNPSSVEVQVDQGRVILSGPVLADEVQQLVRGVARVRGVRDVENRLEVHDEPGAVPGLQGDVPKPTGRPPDVLQRRWSPSTRFLVGAAGMFLLLSASRYPKSLATLSALAGLGLLTCGASDLDAENGGRKPERRSEAELTTGWGQ